MVNLIPNGPAARLRRIATALPLTRAGTAVVVFSAVLIAAGAYGLRGTFAERGAPTAPAPVVTERLSATLSSPAPDAGNAVAARPGANDRTDDSAAARPRPDSLLLPRGWSALPDTSRLSRIFRGAPPVVPPERPSAEAREGATVSASLRPRSRPRTMQERPAPQRSASLRPRQRPADLTTPAPAQPQERVARQESQTGSAASAPERGGAPADRTAALTARPEVVRTSARCHRRLSAAMPRRTRDAAGASTVMARLRGVDGITRDARAVREVLSGNIPDFLRDLRPVSLRGRDAGGNNTVITLCVTPDYLAIGSNRDHVRIPLGLRAATRIGGAFGMVLPTPRMVNLIHRAADLRLAPRPMPAGPQMRSTDYLTRHNATVAAQISKADAAPGALISGHKKDVVLTTRLAERPGRVAIYGWHRANGEPIQPLSTVHGAGYADYSHGIRLVSRTAYLDGRAVDLRQLLASPRYAALLSDEGPVTGPRLRMAALAGN